MYRNWSQELSWISFHCAHQSSRPQLGFRLWQGQPLPDGAWSMVR